MNLQGPPPHEPPDGDFARYVQRVHFSGNPAPGEVHEPPKPSAGERAEAALQGIKHAPRHSVGGWVVSVATVFTMGAMSYMALSEEAITLSGKRG